MRMRLKREKKLRGNLYFRGFFHMGGPNFKSGVPDCTFKSGSRRGCVVTGEKNSSTVAHACRTRRLKWALPQVGGWSTGLATLFL
jgi:hypothetical protein